MTTMGYPKTDECECEPEHSITKLGHCADCPHFEGHLKPDPDLVYSCKHDFEWATYQDLHTSTGVCRCGLWQITHDSRLLPESF